MCYINLYNISFQFSRNSEAFAKINVVAFVIQLILSGEIDIIYRGIFYHSIILIVNNNNICELCLVKVSVT